MYPLFLSDYLNYLYMIVNYGNMEIKGTAVNSIKEFVLKFHEDKYSEWLNSLPDNSREIFQSPIYAHTWYSMNDAAIIPTIRLGELFYSDIGEVAWKSGRYSAEIGLKGIYKAFIIICTPVFLMNRATTILPSYYRPTTLSMVESTKKSFVLHITEFPEPNKIMEIRIAGWIERALEITGCKNIRIEIAKSMTEGHSVTEYQTKWD
jgi:hypothetical protein